MLVTAVQFSDLVLAVHILGAIIGFGVTFAYPVLLLVGGRRDPSVIPWLLRTMQAIGRRIVNPGLTVVVVAGIYLASHFHQWSAFYVQWGIGAAFVIGALEGAIMIPREGKLATIAERDLATTQVPGGGQRTSATWSPEYQRTFRLISVCGALMQLLVVVTVFLMATHAGA